MVKRLRPKGSYRLKKIEENDAKRRDASNINEIASLAYIQGNTE
ncbi:hypothetical protein PVAG01_09007 [Phlyctema vagabunda]|uniref:Ribosomal protein S7 n=1 Tax=Phlyctema vagabunda TaxID=108571 RepID=A0ABR4P653_9HELO